MGRRYTFPIASLVYNTTPIAGMDVAEVACGATMPCKFISCELGSYGDAGDAQAETLPIQIYKGHTVSGSGGASVTPSKSSPSDAAFSGTFEVGNTTRATGPSLFSIVDTTWNVQQGFVYKPAPEEVHEIGAGSRLIVTLPAAPADALALKGFLVLEEIG